MWGKPIKAQYDAQSRTFLLAETPVKVVSDDYLLETFDSGHKCEFKRN